MVVYLLYICKTKEKVVMMIKNVYEHSAVEKSAVEWTDFGVKFFI